MADMLRDEDAHRIIEEALASIRLYGRLGAGPLAAQQAQCVAYILKKTGETRRSRMLKEVADAISRAHGGQGAPDEPPPFDWPDFDTDDAPPER